MKQNPIIIDRLSSNESCAFTDFQVLIFQWPGNWILEKVFVLRGVNITHLSSMMEVSFVLGEGFPWIDDDWWRSRLLNYMFSLKNFPCTTPHWNSTAKPLPNTPIFNQNGVYRKCHGTSVHARAGFHGHAWSLRSCMVTIVMTQHIQSECGTTAMSISGVNLIIISVPEAYFLWIVL